MQKKNGANGHYLCQTNWSIHSTGIKVLQSFVFCITDTWKKRTVALYLRNMNSTKTYTWKISRQSACKATTAKLTIMALVFFLFLFQKRFSHPFSWNCTTLDWVTCLFQRLRVVCRKIPWGFALLALFKYIKSCLCECEGKTQMSLVEMIKKDLRGLRIAADLRQKKTDRTFPSHPISTKRLDVILLLSNH